MVLIDDNSDGVTRSSILMVLGETVITRAKSPKETRTNTSSSKPSTPAVERKDVFLLADTGVKAGEEKSRSITDDYIQSRSRIQTQERRRSLQALSAATAKSSKYAQLDLYLSPDDLVDKLLFAAVTSNGKHTISAWIVPDK